MDVALSSYIFVYKMNIISWLIQCKPDISRLVGSKQRYRDISESAIYRATVMSPNQASFTSALWAMPMPGGGGGGGGHSLIVWRHEYSLILVSMHRQRNIYQSRTLDLLRNCLSDGQDGGCKQRGQTATIWLKALLMPRLAVCSHDLHWHWINWTLLCDTMEVSMLRLAWLPIAQHVFQARIDR